GRSSGGTCAVLRRLDGLIAGCTIPLTLKRAHLTIVFAAAWLCLPGPASVAEPPRPAPAPKRGPARLPPAEVQAAIAWGRQASRQDLEQYVLKVAPTWTLNYDTPFLR